MKWERTIRLSRPLVGIRSPDAEVRGLTPAGGSASHITPSSNLHADTTSPSAAGRADLQELHRLLQDVGHEISELEVRRADAIEELQHTAIELALAVAQQLAGELLERDVERTEHLVRQALAKLPAGEPIVVRLNPHDLARLSALEGCDWPRGVQWLADPSLKPGSCKGRTRRCSG